MKPGGRKRTSRPEMAVFGPFSGAKKRPDEKKNCRVRLHLEPHEQRTLFPSDLSGQRGCSGRRGLDDSKGN